MKKHRLLLLFTVLCVSCFSMLQEIPVLAVRPVGAGMPVLNLGNNECGNFSWLDKYVPANQQANICSVRVSYSNRNIYDISNGKHIANASNIWTTNADGIVGKQLHIKYTGWGWNSSNGYGEIDLSQPEIVYHSAQARLVRGATCTEPAIYHNYCVHCGGSMSGDYYSGNALGHSASARLVSNATCTSAAIYHNYCSRCGASLSDNYYSGNALGHSFTSQTVNSTYLRSNATCTASATYFYKCSRCSAKGTTFYNSGSALGHSNNNVWVTTKEPTCLEDGSKHTNCTRCGSDMNVTAIPKLGHVDNGIWVTETESTCTGTGSKHTNCARCNAILNETVIDAVGHVWDGGTITTAPTVYRTGIRTFTCQTCHDTVTEIEPQYQFTIFAGTKRVRKIAKGTSILFENTTNTDDRLPFIVSTGIATHE